MTVSVQRTSRTALVALGTAALLAVMDGTVVTTALGPLATTFGSPLSTLVWVTVVYLLAAATVLPLLGWANARFGGRRVFLAGLALFVLGSALAGLARSAPELIAFRALQGLGGGLLEPMSLTLTASLATKENVGRVMGTMSMIINVAPVVGPLLGGLLLGTGHWQLIFLVNIPLGLAVLAATLAFVPPDRPAQDGPRPRPDVRGLALLTVGYVALLFAVNRIGQAGPTWVAVGSAGVGVVLLAGYVRHALRTAAPAFDLRLLRKPGFAPCLAVMAVVGFTMYAQLTALPLFAAEHHQLRGVEQGILVCALGVGLVVSMSLGGRLSDRTGPRPLVFFGSIGTAIGVALFALVHDSAPLPVALVIFVVIGGSFGFTAAPSFAAVYRILSPADQPQGTTALFMTVQLTASLAVTVLGLLRAQTGTVWVTVLFGILAVGALATTALSRSLPGRPA